MRRTENSVNSVDQRAGFPDEIVRVEPPRELFFGGTDYNLNHSSVYTTVLHRLSES